MIRHSTADELYEIPTSPPRDGEGDREPYWAWPTSKGKSNPAYWGGDPLPDGVISGD